MLDGCLVDRVNVRSLDIFSSIFLESGESITETGGTIDEWGGGALAARDDAHLMTDSRIGSSEDGSIPHLNSTLSFLISTVKIYITFLGYRRGHPAGRSSLQGIKWREDKKSVESNARSVDEA